MSFNDSYVRLLSALGVVTQSALAKALGIRQSSVAEANKRQVIPPGWLVTARMRFNLDPKYILTGEGKPFIDKQANELPLCFGSGPGAQDSAENDCRSCKYMEWCLR